MRRATCQGAGPPTEEILSSDGEITLALTIPPVCEVRKVRANSPSRRSSSFRVKENRTQAWIGTAREEGEGEGSADGMSETPAERREIKGRRRFCVALRCAAFCVRRPFLFRVSG